MSSGLDKNDIAKNISKVKTLSELESIRIYYLGKKGIITSEMKSLSSFSNEQKKEKGQYLNNIKNFIENELKIKKILLENLEINEKIKKEKIDVTLPPRTYEVGKIHPISQTIYKVINIFGEMGFSVESGPDIESDFNNFTNIFIKLHNSI